MKKFTINDLYQIYDNYRNKHKRRAYKYISQVLINAKPLHKKVFLEMTMSNHGGLLRVKILKN